MAILKINPKAALNEEDNLSFKWSDGSGDSFYLSLNPTTGEIDVISDPNNTSVNRHYSLVFNGDAQAAASGIAQAKAILHITQQVNSLIVATFSDTASIYEDEKAGYIDYIE